jgi:hypothetical protein
MPSIINATTTTGVAVTGDNSGALALQTNNGNTAVTVTTGQNVGVGTASPSTKFHVNGGAINTAIISQTTNAESYIQLQSSGGSSYIGTKTNSIEFLVNSAGNYAGSFDTNGNLLVGTTSTSGSQSNTAQVSAGGYSTVKNQSVVLPFNVATTVFTASGNAGIYYFGIFALASNINAFASYQAMFFDGVNLEQMSGGKAGTQVIISLSGNSVQVTNTFFNPGATFTWGYMKQSLV